ncbi:MAG: methionine--tRNA ligase subunit beta, partial [Ferruginibacter sp.]
KGKVPVLHIDLMDDTDNKLLEEIKNSKLKIQNNIEGYKFRDALAEVIDLARKGNKYMQEKEPWIVAKQLTGEGQLTSNAQKLIDNTLHICLQLTANLAIFINPFLPDTAKKLCYMMKVVGKMLDWENAGSPKLLSIGYSLRAPELLFRKIEDQEIIEQVEKLKTKSSQLKETAKMEEEKKNSTEVSVPPVKKDTIQFDDFAKIELKVGTIVSAEKVEKADKLLKLEIDLGIEKRTIVSGIAQHFEAANIIGKQVTVVTNLAPRKMRGIESNGMILMAEDEGGKLKFVNPDDMVKNGSGVS